MLSCTEIVTPTAVILFIFISVSFLLFLYLLRVPCFSLSLRLLFVLAGLLPYQRSFVACYSRPTFQLFSLTVVFPCDLLLAWPCERVGSKKVPHNARLPFSFSFPTVKHPLWSYASGIICNSWICDSLKVSTCGLGNKTHSLGFLRSDRNHHDQVILKKRRGDENPSIKVPSNGRTELRKTWNFLPLDFPGRFWIVKFAETFPLHPGKYTWKMKAK